MTYDMTKKYPENIQILRNIFIEIHIFQNSSWDTLRFTSIEVVSEPQRLSLLTLQSVSNMIMNYNDE